MATTGTITQVIGSTFDAQFPEDQLPTAGSQLELAIDRLEAALRSAGMRVARAGEPSARLNRPLCFGHSIMPFFTRPSARWVLPWSQ